MPEAIQPVTKLGLTPRYPDNLALLSLCHATPDGWGVGELKKNPETFIDSNTSAKMFHARPRKNGGCCGRADRVGLSPETGPLSPGPAGW